MRGQDNFLQISVMYGVPANLSHSAIEMINKERLDNDKYGNGCASIRDLEYYAGTKSQMGRIMYSITPMKELNTALFKIANCTEKCPI